MKYLALDFDGNIALGFTSYYITISAAYLVLCFTHSTWGNALTYA